MRTVGIYVFDDMEVLDFAGPFEVFAVTGELSGWTLFKVLTIGETARVVRAVNGLRVLADCGISDHPPVDVLVVPGGAGSKAEMHKENVLAWVRDVTARCELTFSVCSGACILGAAGLLDGLDATTHHEVLPRLREVAPRAIIREDLRFTDNGRICTSEGISAGIDLSLYLVERLCGKTVADRTRVYMEYGDWRERR
jgi:transcriptional regulator GlxA family with amidase domain